MAAGDAATGPRAGEVVRHRALVALGRRWDVPLTVVVAPAGFGKSVLLRQAAQANRDDRRGTDHLVACRPSDRVATRLAGRMLDALGSVVPPAADEEEPVALAAAVAAALGALSPRPSCLVLDDVHELADGSGGATLLAALVAELPANGHLVLAGRHLPASVPTARFRARDALVELDADDMAFDADELSRLGDVSGAAPSTTDGLGGWPALVRLSLTAGRSASLEFLRQEVLDGLPEDLRTDLGVAVVAGSADDPLLLEVGAGTPAAELARRVPLVELADDGRAVPHSLWRDVVDQVAQGRSGDLARRVAAALRADGLVDDPLDVLAAAGAWDEAAAILREVVVEEGLLLGRAPARRWAALFPVAERDRPEVLLLRGIVQRLTVGDRQDPLGVADSYFTDVDGDDRGTVADDPLDDLLRRAGAGFLVADRPEAAAVALLLRLWTALDRSDAGAMAVLAGEAAAVEARWPGALGVHGRVIEGVALWFAGDLAGGLAVLDAVVAGVLPPTTRAFVELQRAGLCLVAGEGEKAVAAADAARRAALDVTGTEPVSQHVVASWLAGDPGPALAILSGPQQVVAAAPQDRFRALVYGYTFGASLGLAPPLDVAAAHVQGSGNERDALAVALAAAVVDVAHGDEAGAAERLGPAVAGVDLADPVLGGELRHFLLPVHVLVPEVRPALAAADLGPLHRRTLALARLLVAGRAGDRVDWDALPPPMSVIAWTPLPWSVELAVAAHGAGHRSGRALLDALLDTVGDSARTLLRSHAERADGDAARALLATVPTPPDAVVGVRALGVVEVVHGDGPPEVPNRRRVRELLALLVLRGEVTREVAMATLWPDLDLSRARNNLNVTVRHLRSVLEPHRRGGEAPFVLRTAGSTVRLAATPHLRVDLWEARRLVAEARAHEGHADLDSAVSAYRGAVAGWTGEPLEDLAYIDLVAAEREAVRATLLDAACRGAELAAARHEHAVARDLAELALARDAWSERAHRVLIAVAVAGGDDAGARAALVRAEAAAAEAGVPLAPETRALAVR